jgi:glyoxylase-like metal-dependent hydrolase (beta-lactamase superfamily II)
MISVPVETVNTSSPVVMFTAPNPGPKTLDGTNTFVVGRDQAYIIDPGPNLESYQDFLAQWLQENERRPLAVLLTHGHPDHASGAAHLKNLLTIPLWSSAAMADEQARRLSVDNSLEDGRSFVVDGDTLRVIASPGHAADHVAFWLEEPRILFSGDTLLGQGSTLIAPPEGDMSAYMDTLEAMQRLRPRLIAPGHGPIVTDPELKIEEYIRHRREREEQLLQILARGPAGEEELVYRVYVDVDPALRSLARGSVQAQLAKLVAERKVIQSGEVYRLSDTPR